MVLYPRAFLMEIGLQTIVFIYLSISFFATLLASHIWWYPVAQSGRGFSENGSFNSCCSNTYKYQVESLQVVVDDKVTIVTQYHDGNT